MPFGSDGSVLSIKVSWLEVLHQLVIKPEVNFKIMANLIRLSNTSWDSMLATETGDWKLPGTRGWYRMSPSSFMMKILEWPRPLLRLPVISVNRSSHGNLAWNIPTSSVSFLRASERLREGSEKISSQAIYTSMSKTSSCLKPTVLQLTSSSVDISFYYDILSS